MSLGVEYGCKYTLIGPDGTTVVFNDASDPNFIGVLSPESSGLDSPDVREDASDAVEEDGGHHGDFYYGRRPVVLQGEITAASKTQRNERVGKLQRASNAMRADATLKWKPEGATEEVELKLRRQQPLRITKGYVKAFQLPMVSPGAAIFGATAVSKSYWYARSPLTMQSLAPTEDAAVGTATWIEMLNAATENGLFAITTMSAAASSRYLKVSFSSLGQIPPVATILGIEIKIKGRYKQLEGAGAAVFDNSIRLYKENVLAGSNLASGVAWSEANTVRAYGGAENLWGTTWSPAQLNAEGKFACGISLKNTGTKFGAGEVDGVTAIITYSAENRKQTATITGTIESYPVIKIYGPFENPTIKNITTGKTLTLNYTLTSATDYVEIDFRNHTIKKNGTANIYGVALNFAASTWWGLIPGANEFEVASALKSEIEYRNAWL